MTGYISEGEFTGPGPRLKSREWVCEKKGV